MTLESLVEGLLADASVGQALDDVVVVTLVDSVLLGQAPETVARALLVDVLLSGLAADDLAGGSDLVALRAWGTRWVWMGGRRC